MLLLKLIRSLFQKKMTVSAALPFWDLLPYNFKVDWSAAHQWPCHKCVLLDKAYLVSQDAKRRRNAMIR